MKPIPVTSPLTELYWQAAQEGKLVIQRCSDCFHWQHFPREHCENCHNSALNYEQVSGRGKVSTFSTVYRSFSPSFTNSTPFTLAWIELEEQAELQVFGNLIDTPLNEIHIGMQVHVIFEDRENFGKIPNFTLLQNTL